MTPAQPEPEPDTLVYTSDSSDGPAPTEAAGDPGHLEQPLLDPSLAEVVQSELGTGPRAADPERG
ncbi:MAG TPA: hypothetical protein VER39_07210 [Nocardioidaceae bacterium]|nr:hypothetical protein [Nocardioidaceae bacterium]